MSLGQEAFKPNPALARFSALIGMWNTIGTHPMIPNTVLHGRTSFEWIEGGAFLMMRSEIDEPGIPSGVAIIGSDDKTGEFSMLYFDERGVTRRYETDMTDLVWTWSRMTPDFSLRFVCTFTADIRTMVGKGTMSKDGGKWEGDLELTCTRAD
jgi:hypothetical protein